MCTIEDEEGNRKPQFRISYSKPTKRHVAKIVKEVKREDYLFDLMGNIVERAKQQKRVSVENRSKRQLDQKIAGKQSLKKARNLKELNCNIIFGFIKYM